MNIDENNETNSTTVGTVVSPPRRGFAAMSREQVQAIAQKGGRAAHSAGTAHKWTSEEARNAGRKGGMTPRVRRSTLVTVSEDTTTERD